MRVKPSRRKSVLYLDQILLRNGYLVMRGGWSQCHRDKQKARELGREKELMSDAELSDLIEAGKNFDLMFYPMRKHNVSDRPARRHLYNKMLEFWVLHL